MLFMLKLSTNIDDKTTFSSFHTLFSLPSTQLTNSLRPPIGQSPGSQCRTVSQFLGCLSNGLMATQKHNSLHSFSIFSIIMLIFWNFFMPFFQEDANNGLRERKNRNMCHTNSQYSKVPLASSIRSWWPILGGWRHSILTTHTTPCMVPF